MKYIGAALALGLLSSSLFAQSGTVSIWDGPYPYGIGSEFTALANPSLLAGYSPLATATVNGQTGFETFCLQTQVTLNPGSGSYPAHTYNFSSSLSSVGSPDAFALSEGAAWLYSQFAKGCLANFDYANTGKGLTAGANGSRSVDAGALQAAFWYLQGGQSFGPSYPFGGMGNVYYDDALSHFGSMAAMDANATGATDFGVEVMNLTDSNGDVIQNQLIYTTSTVADSGTTFSLAAGSVAGLFVFAARSRRATV